MSSHIRPFQQADLPIVVNIAKQSTEYAWSESVFCDCLKAHYHIWVLELEKPVGFLVLLDKLNECELLNFCVSSDEQRQGYGQQLLAHAVSYAKLKGFLRILLEVRVSNLAAIALYRKAGFIEVGIRKNYYPTSSGREDALLMTMSITS